VWPVSEREEGKAMTTIDEDTARGVGRYILAWNIASLSTFGFLIILDLAIPVVLDRAYGLAMTGGDVWWFVLIDALIQTAGWLFVWIFVYSLFKSLNIRLVMPWLWGAGIIGVAFNILKTVEILTEQSQFAIDQSQLSLMAPVYLLSLVSEVKIFPIYCKSRGRF